MGQESCLEGKGEREKGQQQAPLHHLPAQPREEDLDSKAEDKNRRNHMILRFF